MSSSSLPIIDKRLQDILISHECSLSNLNLSALSIQRDSLLQFQPQDQTITTAATTAAAASSSTSHTRSDIPLSVAALYRTCSCGNNGDYNDTSINTGSTVLLDVNLNPPERVSPQDLLLHDKQKMKTGRRRNNINKDGTSCCIDVDIPSLQLKTITVLSTLCDEAHELHSVGISKIIPRIYLFGHDLKQHNDNSNMLINVDIMSMEEDDNDDVDNDEIHLENTKQTTFLFHQQQSSLLVAKRDTILLQRISTFMIHLQSTQNYILRCQKLIQNILCQLHGSLSPIYIVHNDDVDHDNDIIHDDIIHDDNINKEQQEDDKEGMVENDDQQTKGSSHRSVPLFIHPTGKSTTSINSTTESHTTTKSSNKYNTNTKPSSSTTSKSNTTTTTKISHPPIYTKAYHLTILGEAISKLLSILITLDAIIAHNFELHEAWDLYKSIVTDRAEKLEEQFIMKTRNNNNINNNTFDSDSLSSRSSNNAYGKNICDDYPIESDDDNHNSDNINNNNENKNNEENDDEYRMKLTQLERMIMQIDFTLLSSRSFLICIEQNFDHRNRFCFNYDHNVNNHKIEDDQKQDSFYTLPKKSSSGVGGGSSEVTPPYPSRKPLYEHMKIILTTLYERYCSVIDTPNEQTEREDMVGLYGLYCLYRRLVPSNKVPDEKLHKSLCTVFPSIYPVIPLYGNVSFMPIEFITKFAPLDITRGMSRGRSRVPKREEIMDVAKDRLDKQDKLFSKKVSLLYDEGLTWLLQAETDLAPSERMNNTMLFEDGNGQHDMMLTPSDHQNSYAMNTVINKTDIILRGLMIARRSTLLLKSYLFLHKFLQIPIGSNHLHAIEQLCSLAKSVEKVLSGRRRSCIISIHKAALKMLASSLYSRFDKLRSFIDEQSVDHGKESSHHGHIVSLSTSLWAVESILKGTSIFSPSRRFTIEVAICSCFQETFQCINTSDMNDINKLMNQIRVLSEIDVNVAQSCDCSFLYYHKDLYPVVMNHLFKKSEYSEAASMQLMMNAFSDAIKMLRVASYFDPESYLKQYRQYVIDKILYREFLVPLCYEIETSLRLLLFARNVDEMKPINPKQQKIGQYRKYIEMRPLQICGISLYTKKAVERYLERSFYNFSTIRDAKTYEEMSILARQVYGLCLIKNNLPSENVQDIDLVDILAIDTFTKKYNYNMVQQNFVERKSNDGSKYLKTLGIETLSNSFRRHGLGIVKNLIYEAERCLLNHVQQLVTIFSDSLFRSLLSKESRLLEQCKSMNNDVRYSLDRAIVLQRELSKVGKYEGEEEHDDNDVVGTISLLDQCRECITVIGNTLGLCRLVRSAKMFTKNQSKKYFPTIPSGKDNEDYDVYDDFLHEMTIRLKKATTATATTQKVHHSSDTTKETFLNFEYTLLQNFYILFPSLSLTWLDASMRGKDMLNKKFQTFDAYYTDDGFALGSAFLFEILDQSSSLDKLNWFESCCVSFARNRKEILENLKKELQQSHNSTGSSKRESTSLLFGSKSPSSNFNNGGSSDGKMNSENSSDNELSRMRVLAKRLEIRKQEMELLQYSVLGARVFFTCSSQEEKE